MVWGTTRHPVLPERKFNDNLNIYGTFHQSIYKTILSVHNPDTQFIRCLFYLQPIFCALFVQSFCQLFPNPSLMIQQRFQQSFGNRSSNHSATVQRLFGNCSAIVQQWFNNLSEAFGCCSAQHLSVTFVHLSVINSLNQFVNRQ